MSIASKYNKVRSVVFKATGDGLPYVKLGELQNKDYAVRAVFINPKSKYGESAAIISDEFIVNLPKHLNDVIKEMLVDTETTDAINAGHFGFRPYAYIDDKGIDRFSVNWVDLV